MDRQEVDKAREDLVRAFNSSPIDMVLLEDAQKRLRTFVAKVVKPKPRPFARQKYGNGMPLGERKSISDG